METARSRAGRIPAQFLREQASRGVDLKFVPLIWSGIWRKPVRTALIFLQVCVAFALFGVLQGMKSGMDRAIANVRADILYVGPAVVGGARLPIAELNRLQLVP